MCIMKTLHIIRTNTSISDGTSEIDPEKHKSRNIQVIINFNDGFINYIGMITFCRYGDDFTKERLERNK